MSAQVLNQQAPAADDRGLQTKIDAFLAARQVFLADSTYEEDSASWDAYCQTEHEVIIHPCTTMDEVRMKARFFLECEPAYDTIRNCRRQDEETLRPFLRSLVGEVAA